MLICASLNPKKIAIAWETYGTGEGNMTDRRSMSTINIHILERLQQQDPAQGIESYLCLVHSYFRIR